MNTSLRPAFKSIRRAAVELSSIRLLVLDVDGVMTDGRLYFDAKGESLKVFNVRDGYGIKQIARAGVEVAVITGRKSAAVASRCRDLGIRNLFQGVEDKLAVFNRLRAKFELPAAECACIGDDLPDVPVMEEVGLAFAVADAHPVARKAAHYVTSFGGGHGAVREVCDGLLGSREPRTSEKPKGRK